MEIYSHKGIDDGLINEKQEYTNDYGEAAEFSVAYNKSLVVNMPYGGKGKKLTNEQGWLRDLNYYYEELLLKNPEFFSKKNIEKIKNRRSPYCDQTFVTYFPEYNCYIGSKLIHHHIGRDGQVVAVPSDIHVGQGGVHLVERVIGIDTNAINFSSKVAEAVDAGVIFKWEEANQYVNEVSNSRANDVQAKSDNSNANDSKDKRIDFKQESTSTNNKVTNGKNPSFKKLNVAKGVLKKGLGVVGNSIKSPIAEFVKLVVHLS